MEGDIGSITIDQSQLNRVSGLLNLEEDKLNEIAESFQKELRKGLENEGQMIKALPTFITELPSGHEQGEYLVVDLGGSNLRVGCVKLLGEGKFELNRIKWQLKEEILGASGEQMFGFIADCILEYLRLQIVSEKLKNLWEKKEQGTLGFTFSYPVKQEKLAHGILLQWSKAIKNTDVIGTDIVVVLQSALAAKGLGNIKVVALLNDTVGTLMANAYRDPRTKIAVILGTGTNCAYVEDAGKIKKLGSAVDGQMIVNVEWGAFGDDKPELLPATCAETIVDGKSENPGKQLFEKMVSGMYLGRIANEFLYCLTGTRSSFDAKKLSTIAATAPCKIASEKEDLSTHELNCILCKVKKVCGLVVQRSAQLCAALIAGIYRSQGSPRARTVVAFDGSLYELYPGYPEMLKCFVDKLDPENSLEFQVGKDESMIGAAVVLATSSNR